MKSSLIGKAIRAINPSAKFTVHGDNTDTIDWLKDTTPISASDIETKVNELKANYDANKYQRDREAEYISSGVFSIISISLKLLLFSDFFLM